MMRAAVVLASLLCAPAYAETCEPAVQLDGTDESLLASIAAELRGRGIATSGACAREARVERDGEDVVVSIADASRTVRGVGTAATVIESFIREDVGSPLLEVRNVTRTRAELADEPIAPTQRALPRGWHAIAGIESSLASDGTGWGGMQVGACRMLGPLCPGIRVRGTAVATEHGQWSTTRRKSAEFFLSLDVPFAIGRYLLMPGVGAGIGGVSTRDDGVMGKASRSDNARAQAHISFSIPLTRTLAVDLYAAGTLVQQVDRNPGYMDETPAEPYGFLRFGVAMRYGLR